MRSLLTKIKFLFVKKGEFYLFLRKTLGFTPGKMKYYELAITHRSMTAHGKKRAKHSLSNNERLEFLGDAVLETVISDILYHKFPKKNEGFLSVLRSKLVERKYLGQLSKQLGLDDYIRIMPKSQFDEVIVPTQTNVQPHNNYLGGNTFEALMGAIYMDKGYKAAQTFINRLIKQGYIDIKKESRVEDNYKSRVLEWCQAHRVHINFVTLWESSRPAKEPTFGCAIMMEGRKVTQGSGFSKKECHQNTSKKVLTLFKNSPQLKSSVIQMSLMRRVFEELAAELAKEKEASQAPDEEEQASL